MVSLRRPHYAWIICLGGALSLFAVMGMGINVFSVYQPYIIQLNGFSNAQGSWITTTRSLFILAALLTVNQLCARLGLRLVMTLGVVLLSLSCFCFGLAASFFTYCLAAALTGLGYCYGGMVPLSLIISRWFRDRRSLALGLAAAGSGVSTILVAGSSGAYFHVADHIIQMDRYEPRDITALAREDYLPVESRSALERMFGGSAKNLIAAMAQTKDLSKEDIDELAAYLEELKQGGR